MEVFNNTRHIPGVLELYHDEANTEKQTEKDRSKLSIMATSIRDTRAKIYKLAAVQSY